MEWRKKIISAINLAESWLPLILTSVTLLSVTSILQRVMLKKDDSDPIAYSVIFQICISLLYLIYGLVIGDIRVVGLLEVLPGLAVMTVIYGLGGIGIFTALKHTEASKYTVLFSSRALFSAIGFTIILGDVFDLKQALGALLLIGGIIVVNYGDLNWRFKKGDLYALLAGLCFGIANINDRILLNHFTLYTYLFLAFLFPPLFTLIISPKTVQQLRTVFSRGSAGVLLLTVVVNTLGSLAFFAALKVVDSPSKVTTVNLLGVIVTVVMAVVFLKERDRVPQKLAGAILSMVGVYLIV